VLRRIFVPEWEELAEVRKELQNEEFQNLYSSPNIIGVDKSGTIGWAKHVARMGKQCIQNFGGKT